MRIATIQPDHKIQLPPEWVDELGLHAVASLEKTDEGIVVRPCVSSTWDDVFADKLPVGTFATALDLSEVSGDDYIF